MAKYRMRVECLRCGKSYVTNLRHRKSLPRRCKFCGSSILRKINGWRVK